jgi:hypothetical protein
MIAWVQPTTGAAHLGTPKRSVKGMSIENPRIRWRVCLGVESRTPNRQKRSPTTIAGLIDGAVASGDIRLDLDPLDLLRALAGVANVSLGSDGKQAAKRMVDILMAGMRTRT